MKIYFVLFCLVSLTASKELKMVVEFFRHGYRSPARYVEGRKDIIGNEWDINSGELTKVGARQHYILGQQIRKMYIEDKKFLSKAFEASEFKIIATDFKRTFDSANNHLSGMYPPGSHAPLTEEQATEAVPPVTFEGMDQLKEDLGTAPTQLNVGTFPIETSFKEEQYINFHDECKGFNDKDKHKSEEFKNLKEEILKNVYDEIAEDINVEDKGYFEDDGQFESFMDHLDMNIGDVYAFPERFKEHFIDTEANTKFHDEYFSKIWFKSEENYVSRASMSRVLRDIIEKASKRVQLDKENKEEYTTEDPKMLIYSAHDSILIQLQRALSEAFDFKFESPYVASNILFELNKEEEDYTITMISNGNTVLAVPIKEFSQKTQAKLIPDSEIDEFCGFNTSFYLQLSAILALFLII